MADLVEPASGNNNTFFQVQVGQLLNESNGLFDWQAKNNDIRKRSKTSKIIRCGQSCLLQGDISRSFDCDYNLKFHNLDDRV